MRSTARPASTLGTRARASARPAAGPTKTIVVHCEKVGDSPHEAFEFQLELEHFEQWQAVAKARGQTLSESLEGIVRDFVATHPILSSADQANARAQIAAHGPGLTFGELAIGECFDWPAPIPRGGPITKVDESHYEFLIHGGRALDGRLPDGTPMKAHGTAKSFYRVERR